MTLHEVERIPVENCHHYAGMPVCAVLKDGTHIYGILGGMHEGKLIMHRAVKGPGKVAVNAAQVRRTLAAKAKARAGVRAKTGSGPKTKALFGYPYYPYPGPYAVDAALVALLFALPFFLI